MTNERPSISQLDLSRNSSLFFIVFSLFFSSTIHSTHHTLLLPCFNALLDGWKHHELFDHMPTTQDIQGRQQNYNNHSNASIRSRTISARPAAAAGDVRVTMHLQQRYNVSPWRHLCREMRARNSRPRGDRCVDKLCWIALDPSPSSAIRVKRERSTNPCQYI